MIKISKITIDVNDTKLELTIEQANELKNILENLLKKNDDCDWKIIVNPAIPYIPWEPVITCSHWGSNSGEILV